MTVELQPVTDLEALDYLERRGARQVPTFDWRDMWQDEHAAAFTVAKSTGFGILGDVYGAVEEALADGQTFEQFRDGLEPLLRAEGWWGRETAIDPATGELREVQLGSPRRLRIIYDTNIRMAHAAGKWQRIARVADRMPWLRYVAVQDSRTRPEHMAWHGTVLRWDHPFWQTHYPPNGWRCRCMVQQLGDRDLARYGRTPSDGPPAGAGETRPWTNKRTGETIDVPVGIDPGFGYNVGAATSRAAEALRVAGEKAAALPSPLDAAALAALRELLREAPDAE